MDLSSHAGDIPIPINTSYAHGHSTHHDHIPAAIPHNQVISSSNNNNGPSMITASIDDDHHHHGPYNKKTVRYKECLKNHAAAMGGNATDGCGEFMPSGDEGSIEALTCLACNCHRNFHRKETAGDTASSSCDCYHSNPHFNRIGRKVVLSHHNNIFSPEALGYHPAAGALIPSGVNVAVPHPHQMIMPYSMGSLPAESDEQEDGGAVLISRPPRQANKRFRTKFTQEQKEKMLNFAEKVGWKMQRQEEAMVQQFCQENGVKRRVLKVWMHNNKHNLAKKNVATTTTTTTMTTTTTTT